MNLENILLMKPVTYYNHIGFHLHELCRLGKCRQQLVEWFRGWEEEGMGVIAQWIQVSVWDDERVLEMVVIFAQHCEYN